MACIFYKVPCVFCDKDLLTVKLADFSEISTKTKLL